MENFKLNLDRPKLSSEEINARQNFDQVLSKFNQTTPPVYKNPWFWGSAGLATVGLTTIITLNAFTLKPEKDDKISTLKSTELPPDTECVKPPVKGEDVPFVSYEVNPQKDQTITLESGTTVEIKKGSLLAENPNEPVEINIREFPDKASAFVAGIPMDYQENSAFESAGMIEIRGEQDDQIVKINPQLPIEVEMVTTQNPETFDFWALNESNSQWSSYPAENLTKTKTTAAATNPKQQQIQSLQAKNEQVEQKIVQVTKELQELKKPTVEAYKIPIKGYQQFDLSFDRSEYPELESFRNVVFEVVPFVGYDPSFTTKTWSSVDLNKEGDRYLMTFQNSKEKVHVPVRPVLEGKELKTAQNQFDAALDEFKTTKLNLEQEKANLVEKQKENNIKLNQLLAEIPLRDQTQFVSEQAQMTKSAADLEIQNVASISSGKVGFRTTQWGIFNCDKEIPYPKAFVNGVVLMWIGDQVAKFKRLFVFDKSDNTRFSYGEGYRNIESLGFKKRNDLVLVGITEDGQIGYTEISKEKNKGEFEIIVFSRKDKSSNTLDFLKKLLNESTAVV